MISTLEYCQEHPNQKIGGIYIEKDNRNISRKVCMECMGKFNIPQAQILFRKDFDNKLLQKTQLNLNSIQELNKSKSFFKNVLQQFDRIQEEITLIFKNIRDTITKISEEDSAGNEKFIKLINSQNLNPFECSQTELDFLVNFLEGNIFEEWINKKKFIASNIEKTGVLFERVLQNAYKTNHLVEQIQTYFNGKVLGQRSEQTLNNVEQIKHLEFIGQYGIKGCKIKKWNYFWKGQLVGGGMYNLMGQKQGNWIDLCDNYSDLKNVVEQGNYEQDNRIGVWKLNRDNQLIGGGEYNEQGIKIGKWIVLSDGFMDSFQLTYSGEYQNGKKVGSWDIKYEEENIGGGLYDNENGVKTGKWIEIIESLKNCSKVTFNGEYKNCKKFGRWDINYQGENIGGGSYDNEDDVKIGRWIDISERFERESQITYNGEYKNGQKIGRYNICYKKNYGDNQNEQIGGGAYDDEGQGIKIGSWIELSDKFKGDSQIILRGEYTNGKKIGKWEILFRDRCMNNFELIAGGYYDKGNDNIKIGRWIEINDNFASYSQVIYNGEYKNNKKFGRWDIQYRKNETSPFKQIGGGSYDESSQGIKIGKWIEISDRFWRDSQVIFKGEYKNGNKIGKWEILHKEKDQDKFEDMQNNPYKLKLSAGGYYDNDSIKIGKWIELDDGFNYNKQLIYKGEYENGKKLDTWIEMDIKKSKSAFK